MAQFKVEGDPRFPYPAGMLPHRESALAFVDYLASRGIEAAVQAEFNDNFTIYAAQESDVPKIKLELIRLGSSPYAKLKEYNQAAWSKRSGEPAGQRHNLRSSLADFYLQPFSVTTLVEVICVLLYLVSFFPGVYNSAYALLGLYHLPHLTEDFQIWRLITPIFFHFGFLHIAFNLVMWEAFARRLERALGRLKLFSLLIVIAMLSNALEFAFLPQPAAFGGLSGVVYGIIGYMGVLSLNPRLPYALRVPRGLLAVCLIFIAFGFFMSGVANFCHVGGIAAGALWGFIDSRRLKAAS